jgi:hypothetical protein
VYTPGNMRVDGTLQLGGAAGALNSGGLLGTLIVASGGFKATSYIQTDDTASYGSGVSCWGVGTLALTQLGRCAPSSRKYKNTITDYAGNNYNAGLDELRALRPVNYFYNPGVINDTSLQSGFIAEEVEQVNPDYVFYNNGQVDSVKYDKLTVLLTKALQQLDVQVQTNQARLAVIESGEFAGDIHVVGDAQIGGKLTVTGDTIVQQITINGKIITAGTAPTIAAGLAAGDALTATATVTGNDTAGTLSITTGAVGTIAGEVLSEVTFNTPYTQAPIVTVSPTTEDSASIRFFLIKTTTGWSIKVLDAPVANKTYSFDYHVIQ